MGAKYSGVASERANGSVPAWIESLRAAVLGSLSEKDMREIMRCIVDQAKTGDVSSQKIILDYILGGPKQITNVGIRVDAASRHADDCDLSLDLDRDAASRHAEIVAGQRAKKQRA